MLTLHANSSAGAEPDYADGSGMLAIVNGSAAGGASTGYAGMPANLQAALASPNAVNASLSHDYAEMPGD